MIINKLLTDQIAAYWEFIKYAVVSANGMKDSPHLEEYCRNLLCNLLSGKYQCWMGYNDAKDQIKGVAVTQIQKDVGDIPYVFIDSVYVYNATDDREKLRFIDVVKDFGDELQCKSVVFRTANDSIVDIANRFGFEEPYRTFRLELGGTNGRK
jgi:hypothetical protein